MEETKCCEENMIIVIESCRQFMPGDKLRSSAFSLLLPSISVLDKFSNTSREVQELRKPSNLDYIVESFTCISNWPRMMYFV